LYAGDPKAAEFREFWGERSQLRRFQDGVVKEVVVWGDKQEEVIGKSGGRPLGRQTGGGH